MTPKISNNDMLETKDFLDSLRLEIIDGEVNFELALKSFLRIRRHVILVVY